MHVRHKYDSFKDAMKSEFTDSNFVIFCVGGHIKFEKFWFD